MTKRVDDAIATWGTTRRARRGKGCMKDLLKMSQERIDIVLSWDHDEIEYFLRTCSSNLSDAAWTKIKAALVESTNGGEK